MTTPLVYLAMPYTKPDPVENMHKAFAVADSLLDVCVPFVPHFTMFWHFHSPKGYETWLEIDKEYLRRCDALLRLGGESTGADREVRFAQSLGLPTFYSTVGLRSWIEHEWAAV